MPRLPQPGQDDGVWGDILNDYLKVAHDSSGSLKPAAVSTTAIADGSITSSKLAIDYLPTSQKATANGVASLDAGSKVPLAQLPTAVIQQNPDWNATSGITKILNKPSLSIVALSGSYADLTNKPSIASNLDELADVDVASATDGQVLTYNDGTATWAPTSIATTSVNDASTSAKGIIQLAGDLSGTATSPTVPGLASKADVSALTAHTSSTANPHNVTKAQIGLTNVDNTADANKPVSTATQTALNAKAADSAVVHNTGTETVAGVKTFSSSPIVPTPTTNTQVANKSYVDGVAGAGAPDASTSSKGVVQLAGDLSGTATSPTVPGLSSKVPTTTTVSGAQSLTGGGDLTTNRTLSLVNDATTPGNSRYYGTNSGGTKGYHALPVATKTLPYSIYGNLVTETGSFRLYNDTSSSWTIQSVRATVGTAPTGSSLVIDININGTTIFTTQGNRPTITAGGSTSGKVINMDIVTVATGQYLTVDVDQVGSTTPGRDLTVQLEVF